jgi:hypothetical protein
MWMWSETGGERAELRGADLCHADLRGADLLGADLCHADLRGADLRGADLRGTDLRGTNLRHADLRGADLRGADLHEADLRGTNLRHADLYEANLWGAVGNGKEIKSAHFDKWSPAWTQSPEGVHWLQIGCQRMPLDKWENATDLQISAIDSDELLWWRRYRDTVLGLVKASPAKPWGAAA